MALLAGGLAVDGVVAAVTACWPVPVGTAVGVVVGVTFAMLEWRHGDGGASGDPPPGPRLPEWLIGRPDEADSVITALLAGKAGTVGITTGVLGAGGFGKTTLAAMVANDSMVRRRFRDRVYWVTVGRDVRGPQALARKLNELVQMITGEQPTFIDPRMAGAHLGRVLTKRGRALVVIDDVWFADQLAAFLDGGAECVRLVTTRVDDAMPGGSVMVRVDAMSAEQAQALLTWRLPSAVSALLVEALLRVTGRWPLLLHLVNRAIAVRVSSGIGVDDAAGQVLAALAVPGPAPDAPVLNVDDPQSRSRAVRAAAAASTAWLPDGALPRLVELGVFAEDERVPVDVVALLWGATAGLGRDETALLCHDLARLALLTEDTAGGRRCVRVHDAIRTMLRVDLGDRLSEVNAILLDALAATLPAADRAAADSPSLRVAWWLLADHERYLWDQLAYHLVGAGRLAERNALVTDLRWVGQRLALFGPAAPAADLAGAESDRAGALAMSLGQFSHLLGPTTPPYSVVDILLSRLRDDPLWTHVVDQVQDERPWPHLRNAWPLPDRAPLALRRVLIGHTREVRAVAWSPDGTRLVTGSGDATVRVWDPAAARTVHTLAGHTGGVCAVAWSPDGTRLATATGYRTVRVWDPAAARTVHTLADHIGGVWAVAWSPDGTHLATASNDATVRVLDPTTDRTTHTLGDHTGWVRAVAWSPDGTQLATAGSDATVRVWDLAAARTAHALTGHAGWVWAVAWSPDGTQLATAGDDATVRVWDPATARTVHTLTGHTRRVAAVAWSPDGARLATAGDDATVRVWDLATARTMYRFTGHIGGVAAVAWSPDGARLATAGDDATVRVWDLASAHTVRTHTGHTDGVWAVVWSPDGARLATAGDDATVRVWDAATARTAHVLTRHVDGVWAAAWSPDGTRLATAGSDAMVWVWDAATARAAHVLTRHTSGVRAVAWSPDGTRLATASDDRTVRIWDPASARTVHMLTRHTRRVTAMAWSPDGTRLATADGRTVRIWDPARARTAHVLTRHTGEVMAVRWSPDGTQLATASDDRTVRIWDAVTARATNVLTGHTGRVLSVAWSPDGTRLATASHDATVRIWDASDGAVMTMMRVEAALSACEWSPDGHRLAAVGTLGVYVFIDHPGRH